ncbi:hypothetical protein [Noviherbaspirillum soli]|uniref:hypothetical protein n=1 Tax=Noviherbaspirillum soli TaxID=1064518 RepID=UPI00188ABEB4|nr:hypothetical protein [Noviherbaspirillum soli]
MLLELVLWAGLICFLWVMKDSLGKIESELERTAAQKAAGRSSRGVNTVHVDRLYDPIGRLGDTTIYRFAIIDGQNYEFDYVAAGKDIRLAANQRCLPPGLVYSLHDDTNAANAG